MSESKVEMWAPVHLHQDYEVSSEGRIRCCRRRRYLKPGDIIAQQPTKLGYLLASINGRPFTVHRIVCHAFHGAPPTPKHEAAHNNGIRSDNRSENLRWATRRENSADIKLHGTENPARGEKQGHALLTADAVLEIRRKRSLGATQPQLAMQYNVARTTINAVCNRYSWRHV